jgi:hypothetical protein
MQRRVEKTSICHSTFPDCTRLVGGLIHALGEALMETFIHSENLALYRRRLAEPHTEAEREVLLKLLAEEQARAPAPNKLRQAT